MKTRFAAQKTTGIALIFMLIFFLQGYSFCQDKQNPSTKPSEKSQTLTPQQTAAIKTILSRYDASKLTAADARAIHEKFRQAAGAECQPE